MTKSNAPRLTRRAFGATAAGVLGLPTIVRGRDLNSKMNIAAIGVGGRGGGNLAAVAGENIVAVCDVNAAALDAAASRHPGAAKFVDFRKLYEKPSAFDAVVVSTCEHSHAHAVLPALKERKHVYCEKPLSHNVHEARVLRLAAAEAKVTTQMGIQIHATENYRRVVEVIRAGLIGPVSAVHVWVSRAWGLQSEEAAKRHKDIVYVTDRPAKADPVPATLNWDLWLGPAPARPFSNVYFPGPKWYRWWDFGNGTMSDLGSHWNDLPFWALDLKAPLTVTAYGPPPHAEIAPATMSAVYQYPARGAAPPVTLTWHQGESKPEEWTSGRIPRWGDGVLFIGSKGMLLSDYSHFTLLRDEKPLEVTLPEPTLPRPKGHHEEWIACCKAGTQASANFEYSGWLTEANHLGNVAYRAGKKLIWDAEALRATNAPEADRYLRREYRKGWEL